MNDRDGAPPTSHSTGPLAEEPESGAERIPRWLVIAGAVSWRVVATAAAVWFGVQILSRISLVVVPFLIALFLTALLSRPTRLLERLRLPGSIAALIPVVVALAATAAVLAFFVRGVAQQWSALTDAIARGLDELVRLVNLTPVDVEAPDELWSNLGERVRDSSGQLARGTVEAVSRVFRLGTQAVLAVVFAFFLLRDGPMIAERLLRALPARWRGSAGAASERAWVTLERYVVGVTLVALANTIMTALALWILGIPMVWPITLLTFVGSYIPFVGPVVATSAGVFVALAERGPEIALIFLAAGIGIEIIESNVTQPLIQGRVLHLHPIVVIVAVSVGTLLAGLAGTFLAVPIVAAGWSAAMVLRTDDAPEVDGEQSDEAPDEPEPGTE